MAGEYILVIEDEPRYQRLLKFNLEADGYRVTVAGSGEDGLAALAKSFVDLVLLDLMLPGIDGFEVCSRIRSFSTVPIVMVTAKGAKDDVVKGLRFGADDYVTKPFSVPELQARIEAVLRRTSVEDLPLRQKSFNLGGLQIDFLERRVYLENEEVPLTPTEFKMLCCLASSSGEVLTHNYLLEKVWGPEYRDADEMVRVTLWRLRRKLRDDPMNPRFIITRPGMGYMLAPTG